jgi:hypothetical protein
MTRTIVKPFTTLGSLYRDPVPGLVARTTKGDYYRLVERVSEPKGPFFAETWAVEWVTPSGAPLRFNRESKRTGHVELRTQAPGPRRSLGVYAYKVAA